MNSKNGFILGTAGHIDHGKSTLIKALTGIEPDRLKEEQERGISIELGFAHFSLSDGTPVGVVDVPGHEKFVPTMVSGVVGMDLVLLVINVLEGCRAQTQEHLDILSFLGVKRGIVVFTHNSLADKETREIARIDLLDSVKDTFLESAPIHFVDSVAGDGLSDLRVEIERILSQTVSRPVDKPAFLPIDRSFSLKGIGTVITGSLLSGVMKRGRDYWIFPGKIRARLKNIHCYGKSCKSALPGNRVAINLSGVHYEDVKRGSLILEESEPSAGRFLNVSIQASSLLPKQLKTGCKVRVFTGTVQVKGQLFLLDGKRGLKAGEEGFAQIRLEEAIYTTSQMPFLVRQESPVLTLGGGKILVNLQERVPLGKVDIEKLSQMAAGVQETFLIQPLEGYQSGAFLGMEFSIPEEKEALFNTLLSRDVVTLKKGAQDRTLVILTSLLQAWQVKVTNLLKKYHGRNRHRLGLSSAHILSQTRIKETRKGKILLELLIDRSVLKQKGDSYSMTGHQPCLRDDENQTKDKFLSFLNDQKFSPNIVAFSCPPSIDLTKIIEFLMDQDSVVQVADQFYLSTASYQLALAKLADYLGKNDGILAKEARDLFSTSRKFVIPLLEFLDSQKVTYRKGDRRFLF